VNQRRSERADGEQRRLSTLAVINFFNQQPSGVASNGGVNSNGSHTSLYHGSPSTRFHFTLPSSAVLGPAYVHTSDPRFL
jgi:hypothetical protein